MPGRSTLLAPQRAPGAAAIVDWSHPISRGLLWCVAPGAGTVRELVRGQMPVFFGVATGAGVTALGRALHGPGNTGDGVVYAEPDNYVQGNLGTAHTIVIWDVPEVLGNGIENTMLMMPYNAANFNSPFAGMGFTFDGTRSYNMEYLSDSGGTTENFVTDGVNHSGDVGALHMYAVTRNGTVVNFYRDAVQQGATQTLANGGTAPGFGQSATQIVLFNHNNNAPGEPHAGRYSFVGIWSRPLSQGELQRLYAQPFAILDAPSDVLAHVHLVAKASAAVAGGGTLEADSILAATGTVEGPAAMVSGELLVGTAAQVSASAPLVAGALIAETAQIVAHGLTLEADSVLALLSFPKGTATASDGLVASATAGDGLKNGATAADGGDGSATVSDR